MKKESEIMEFSQKVEADIKQLNLNASGLSSFPTVSQQNSTAHVQTIAELKTSTHLQIKDTAVILTDMDKGGIFVWREGDFSHVCALDALEGLCVPALGDNGSGGAFIRQLESDVAVLKWWGLQDNSLEPQQEVFNVASAVCSYVGIENLLASGVGDIWVSAPVRIVIELSKNTKLNLAGRTIKLKPNSFSNYEIIVMRDDTSIFNGEIVGDRYSHTGTSGEWGMGISMLSAKNIVVKDLTIRDCWGDGIYIGTYSAKPAKFLNSKNVYLENVKCLNNRRQGMSVISVDGLISESCEYSFTNGIAPEAGVDFEPNYYFEQLKNIKFNNTKMEGNAMYGFHFYLKKLVSQNIDIEITNTVSLRDRIAFSLMSIPESVSGTVKVENALIQESVLGGIIVGLSTGGWSSNVDSIIKNIHGVDINTLNSGADRDRQLVCLRGKGTAAGANLYSNFDIENLSTTMTEGVASYSVNDFFVDGPVRNIKVRNVDPRRVFVPLKGVDSIYIEFIDVQNELRDSWSIQNRISTAKYVGLTDFISRSSPATKRRITLPTIVPSHKVTNNAVEYTKLGNSSKSADFYIEAAAGNVIYPFGTRYVGFKGSLNSQSDYLSVKLQLKEGMWVVLSHVGNLTGWN